MTFPSTRKIILLAAAALGAVLLWRWGLPLALPFLLGALVALAAEPLVKLLQNKAHLSRVLASAISVTVALLGLLSLLVLLTALLLRQLTGLTHTVPKVVNTLRTGLGQLENTLSQLSHKAPEDVRPLLERTVDSVFTDGGAVLDSLLERLPAAASAVLGYVADSFLAVGTACIAAYMISVRLPQLRQRTQTLPPALSNLLPRIKSIRHALWGWLKAQGKLCIISFAILLMGFWILAIDHPILWAAVTALVDAVPLLGTGTVLIPWALVCLLQDQQVRALGLLCIYLVAMLTRSTLEPRLVGRHLGLDPLLTLVSLYAGYQFWGFTGMLVSPLLCVVIKEAAKPSSNK